MLIVFFLQDLLFQMYELFECYFVDWRDRLGCFVFMCLTLFNT